MIDFTPLQMDRLDALRREGAAEADAAEGQKAKRPVRLYLATVAVALILLTALLGPLVWTQSPSQQWLSQISSPPVGPVDALLVHGSAGAAIPNTERVTLRSAPISSAVSYQFFRRLAHEDGLGVPLGVSEAPLFEDRLLLRPVNYIYTIVALDSAGAELNASEQSISPEPAISLFEAQLQGLVSTGAQSLPTTVRLPAHPLGTDALGRDMLARLIHGARTSLFVGVLAPLLFIGFGTLYGALAGLAGGAVDQWMMRFADFVVALPFLLFMILLSVALGAGPGENGTTALIIALVLLGWPSSARLVRGQVLQIREQAYVAAARLSGATTFYLIRQHIFPNVLGLLLVSLSFAIPMAIYTEAFLSFIGMGVKPPTPSWGSLCNEGMKFLLSHPWQMLFPAAAISITVLAFNILGDALRDVNDVVAQERLA